MRTTQDFKPLDIGRGHVRQIDRAVGCAEIAGVDAIDQDFDVLRIGAAHEDGCLGAWAAALDDVDTRYAAEDVGNGAALVSFNVRGGDDRHRISHLIDRRCDASGAHGERRQHDGIIGICLRGHGGRRQSGKHDKRATKSNLHSHDAIFLRVRPRFRGRIG